MRWGFHLGMIGHSQRQILRLGGEHNVVSVAEDKHFRCAPDDLFQIHHRSHLQPVLPKQKMLNEVAGQAPGPERQVAVANGLEAEAAELENENVGAEKIVAPILEEGRDAAKVLLSATIIERSGRADKQPASRLEHAPTPRQPGVYVLAVADGFKRIDGVKTVIRE